MIAEKPTRLVVFPEHAGLRLDQFLAAATELSRRRARAVAAEGLVWRNGRPARVLSRAVETGDVVDVLPGAGELGVPGRPRLAPVVVIYDDEAVLAADKPAGVLSQPAEHRAPGELAFDEQVLLELAVRCGRRPFLRLLHRLDRLTSGLLLFARSPAVLPELARLWRQRRVGRLYLAVVEGRPTFERQVVDAPLARAADGAWRFEVSAGGRPARTEVEVRARGEGLALVACRLQTGRTHQVRVHLAHLGLPVAGDRLYGASDAAPRPLLHAAELTLPHPATGRRLHLTSPLPADFTPFLEGLGSGASAGAGP